MAAGTSAALRKAVVATAKAMSARGLSPGRSGNVSCRTGAGMLITPSGMPYGGLEATDIVAMNDAGDVPAGSRKPSSEWRFHRDVYRARPDVGAIVHTHSLNATVLACAHEAIPAFHYMVAAAGGSSIPLVPYATFGTEELSNHVVRGLACHDACLMANHGQIAVGENLSAALDLAAEVETLATMYVAVLGLGRVHALSDAEMAVVVEKFKGYGQRAQGTDKAGRTGKRS